MSKEMKMADVFNLPVTHESYHHEGDHVEQCYDAKGTLVLFGLLDDDGHAGAASHAINNHDRLAEENAALREALRLKEAECEGLADGISNIVSAAANAHLSGSEQQHVDNLYRVINDASGSLYNKIEG